MNVPTWLNLVEQRELLAGHLGSGVQVRDEVGQEGLQLGELVEVRGEESAAGEGRGQPAGHCPRNAEPASKSQGSCDWRSREEGEGKAVWN